MTYPSLKEFEAVQVKFQSLQSKKFYDLPIQNNGYLGKPRTKGNFILWAKPFPGDHIVQVEANKAVSLRGDEANRREKKEGVFNDQLIGWHRLAFPTPVTLDGIICTKFAMSNDFRLLRLKDGTFDMSQLAIVSQNGRFYLFVTKQYEGQLLYDSAGFHVQNCPNLDPQEWPQLQAAVFYMAEGADWPEFVRHKIEPDKYDPDGPLQLKPSERHVGKVRWYNPALHYGLVEIYHINNASKTTCRYIVNARVHESRISANGTNGNPNILCAGDLIEINEISAAVTNIRRFQTRFNFEIKRMEILKRGAVYKSIFE